MEMTVAKPLMEHDDEKKVWVVYEANAVIPKIFTDELQATIYRTKRVNRVKHQVYIQPAWIDEEV